MKRYFRSVALVTAVLASTGALAKGGGNRADKRIGIYAGVFSDPFPGLMSFGLKFNVTDFLQLTAGYASVTATTVNPLTGVSDSSGFTSFGGGVKAFMPGWSLSPFVGFNYTKISVTGTAATVSVAGASVASADVSGAMYASFGLDYQAGFGLNLGLGMHYMFSPAAFTSVLTTVPHGYLGFFF